MRSLNETACQALLEDVRWDEPVSLVSLAILALIDVLVIAGNCLVIAAVLCSSKLRSVTNLFIVSLAVADLLVGVAVLPFSATREVFEVWIFGDVWCSVWLAVDVWMCTASILNLCAISLDRYVAVTRPVSYPSIMSRKRAKALIAGLWVLSFVICFPPLVGWKDKKPEEADIKDGWVPNPPCEWTCELTNDAGYVVYSALGSFYIPMFVMLFFYWRIYKAAVRTTKAINQGFRTTKACSQFAGKGMGSRFDDNRLTLRIHRGRGSNRPHGSPLSNASNHSTSTSLSASPERLRRHSSARRAHEKVKISVSYPSSEQICPAHENSMSSSRSPSPSLYAVHYERDGRELTESRLRVRPSHHLAPGPLYDEYDDKPRTTRRMGKRNIKAQVKRFRMETKAAKTLGIIVGGFVFCWLPFFSVYVVRAFCGDCVSPIVFSVLFWLGYCNSAINPLIYALFSKDFRFAFKRIICKCFCGGGGPRRESDAEGSRRQNNRPTHSHSLEEQDANNHTSTTTSTSATDR
ncbi:octopamine receptor Oamb isoform X2 [Spodoptera frugiperda]|uniref:Octopamine receptor Oamb isoform X1 n=1 Tax=Spodoptera frugiperda TaxID=7108 RepID=A0A9R0EYS8_SPOFR|nr:octopamine receptor Oamb isoform X1 [Spodoptera frugiperda]XP_050554128.1 octopamine receptor Oamb isoform X1 [Spodoptera frugiperda]XP_050554129.1 octopamine receptor Oamb isoform X2 [Spodoptera frugiperda]